MHARRAGKPPAEARNGPWRRGGIDVAYGPSGSRTADLGVRPATLALAAAHDLMHSADEQLRSGHIEDAGRGMRVAPIKRHLPALP